MDHSTQGLELLKSDALATHKGKEKESEHAGVL